MGSCSALGMRCKLCFSLLQQSIDKTSRLAYRAGVTTGIVSPETDGFLRGLNTAFSTGAAHRLARGAVVQETGTVHISIHPIGSPSVSTQIAALRNMLLGDTSSEMKEWFDLIKQVRTASHTL